MKKVAVTVPGTGQIIDAVLEPGTTAADLLRAANLPQDYSLSIDGTGEFFAPEDVIYHRVQDGQKLNAMSKMKVG